MQPSALRASLEARLLATLELLRQQVAINSFTAHRDGVNRLGRLTAEQFATLGFHPEFIPHSNPDCGDHLVLKRPGSSPKTIALISHLDTVFPPEEEQRNNFHWQPEGTRIYGPGTIDIKGGTAMMHLVLSELAASDPAGFDSTSWVLLWNSSEETLSRDFARICRNHLPHDHTLAALVFEAEGRPQGTPCLVVARKGRATFRLTVEGRGSHAGAKHPRGANAVVQLARVVDRIAQLTDYSRHLTFNVGSVSGGGPVNRVPHLATAEIEMRAFTPEVYRDGVQAILGLAGPGDIRSAADNHPCQVRIDLLEESPPWPRNAKTDGLFRIWKESADSLGLPLASEERGGLSDGNWICLQFPTLDGLGPHGDNDHCSERSPDGSKVPEYLDVTSIVPKALLNVVALQRLIHQRVG